MDREVLEHNIEPVRKRQSWKLRQVPIPGNKSDWETVHSAAQPTLGAAGLLS